MYGMPTRIRSLYVGVKSASKDELEMDHIDRDVDVSIYEYSPGQSMMRDKQLHESIGFTSQLSHVIRKGDSFRISKSNDNWWSEQSLIADCSNCGGIYQLQGSQSKTVKCHDCRELIEAESFMNYYTPAAFRTSFYPKDSDGTEQTYLPLRREVGAVIEPMEEKPVSKSNMLLATGSKAIIIRRNRGPLNKKSEPEPYHIVIKTQKKNVVRYKGKIDRTDYWTGHTEGVWQKLGTGGRMN